MTHRLKAIVTTSRGRRDLGDRARAAAARLDVPFVPREGTSFNKMFDEYDAACVWVETGEAPVVNTRRGAITYHEGTSVLRTKWLPQKTDPLARALDLQPGDSVLDATLGMGWEALVVAAHLGPGGAVTGIEASLVLCELVRFGLENYRFRTARLAQAAARITPVHACHADFLARCEPGSYDAVYFDPMFERTVQASTMMQRIREVAVDDALSPDLLHRAVKIARRRVAVKCRRGEFMDFAFDDFIPSGGSVGYAVVKCS